MHSHQAISNNLDAKRRDERRVVQPNHYKSVSLQGIIAVLVALFLFVGRWTPTRLVEDPGSSGASVFFIEPRFVIVVFLGLLLMTGKSSLPVPTKQTRPVCFSIFLFLGYMVLSGLWSSDGAAAIRKGYELTLVMVVVYVVAVLHNHKNLRRYLISLVTATSLLLLLLGMVAFVRSSEPSRLSVLGGGPNIFGRNMGVALLCCLFFVYTSKRSRFWVPLGVIAAALVIASGSRGAFLASTISCFIYLLMKRTAWKKSSMLILGFFVGIFLLFSYAPAENALRTTFQARIVDRLIREQYTAGRDKIADEAIAVWRANPVFGAGVGSFNYTDFDVDFTYAHNIFLETASEGGIAGLVLLFMIPLSLLATVLKKQSKLSPFFTACAVLFVVASQFSGDLFDNRSIFIFALLLFYSGNHVEGE